MLWRWSHRWQQHSKYPFPVRIWCIKRLRVLTTCEARGYHTVINTYDSHNPLHVRGLMCHLRVLEMVKVQFLLFVCFLARIRFSAAFLSNTFSSISAGFLWNLMYVGNNIHKTSFVLVTAKMIKMFSAAGLMGFQPSAHLHLWPQVILHYDFELMTRDAGIFFSFFRFFRWKYCMTRVVFEFPFGD